MPLLTAILLALQSAAPSNSATPTPSVTSKTSPVRCPLLSPPSSHPCMHTNTRSQGGPTNSTSGPAPSSSSSLSAAASRRSTSSGSASSAAASTRAAAPFCLEAARTAAAAATQSRSGTPRMCRLRGHRMRRRQRMRRPRSAWDRAVVLVLLLRIARLSWRGVIWAGVWGGLRRLLRLRFRASRAMGV